MASDRLSVMSDVFVGLVRLIMVGGTGRVAGSS